MIERLSHRDLRNRSAEVLRNVAAGHSYEITNHGQVVALLLPASTTPGGTARLPVVRRATSREPFSELPRVRIDGSVQEALDELRAER